MDLNLIYTLCGLFAMGGALIMTISKLIVQPLRECLDDLKKQFKECTSDLKQQGNDIAAIKESTKEAHFRIKETNKRVGVLEERCIHCECRKD